ncbi:type VI secretion system Vgr family protein [Aureliella helgolandensis]|uniref:Phage-related baseplate assembly protein n=1 Tax=Aureliella helgolandensis TaxID=2527968 RepID=A0A518GCW7_9BACT|nr:type VI secretion system tip protein TssI/VgrG [Aureliella helgolandensis]QDV26397.1 Phage-related baseplate assembly protein [Aureliella helgolandensis]
MATRLLELIPNGLFGDKAIVTSLSGREEISQPYEFSLTISSPKDKLKPEEIIGQPLAVKIDRGDEAPRFVHGYISHMWAGDYSQTEDDKSAPSRCYRVRLVPWLWFMTRASRCFVYLPEKLEKSIQEVIDELFERVESYRHVQTWNETGAASILKSRKVEHCVQYRETDFNFLTRTLEQYGVYYYFRHEQDKHTLILSDQPNYQDAPESKVEYHPSEAGHISIDAISSWEHAYEFVPGKYEQTDYDFKQPSTNLKVSTAKHNLIPLSNNSGYEVFNFPGEYMQKDDGEKEVIRRMEEEESRFNLVQGSSFCKSFSPGYTFKLTKHHSCHDEEGKSYLITSITHSATQAGTFSGHGEGDSYSNQFSCMPKESQFRPPRKTPRPYLPSVQTAVVVGPSGEEIYTDEFGRVKVQFHWDREGKRDENTSCWMRVSQVHAGVGFGGIDIPRVGEEVIVSFIEGDLDCPVVTGRLYHKESMPPFGLPNAKKVSGIKTKTYKGSGYNEMSMDDTPGQELINIHAQYDMTTTVEHDDTQTVHNDRTITVNGKHTETIKKDTTIKITEGKLDHDVVDGTATFHVKKAVTENYDATQDTTVKQKLTVTSTTEDIYIDGKTKITLHSGKSEIILEESGVITIKALEINVLGDKMVKISGKMVEASGGKEAKLGVGNQNITCDLTKAAISGAAINSSAVGMHEITGALVKIN